MRRAGLVAALLIAAPALAATVEDHRIELDVSGPSYTRTELQVVALEEPADAHSYERYPVMLDEHIELLSCRAEVLDAGGSVVHRVDSDDFERLDSVGSGLYSSRWATVVPFPPLAVGQRLRLHVRTRHTPGYPAAGEYLLESDPQGELEVIVRGPESLRWRLSDPEGLLEAVETDDGVTIRGFDLPRWDPPDQSPPDTSARPAVRLAWDRPPGWDAVADWYDGYAGLPDRPSLAVQALAASLCDGLSGRPCVDAITRHLKRNVRYEAVEIGVGGWRPTPPDQVLDRGWGDCKDKSALLAALLAAVDVPAHLLLIHSGSSGDLPPAPPMPYLFNHCIVAADADAAAATEADPVVDGLLLIDPSSERGGAGWLGTECQGRPALLVGAARDPLIHVPVFPHGESRELSVVGDINDGGNLGGTADLFLRGSSATPWLTMIAAKPKTTVTGLIKRVLSAAIPGARVEAVEWSEVDGDVPAVRISGDVFVTGVVRSGARGRRSMRLPALEATPDTRILDERSLPVVLDPGRNTTSWDIGLPPDWCPARPRDQQVANSVGEFAMAVATDDAGRVRVDRHLSLTRVAVDPDQFDQLRELAVAERRAVRRRVRLRCPAD